ncbi:MAG: hypothetical protein HYX71_11325 [Opitutae bacterium]|nr:hypothetical protein [Opitutae bacterium]
MSRYAYWIAALLFAALVLAKFDPQTGFTSLIRFGAPWQERRHSALQDLPLATVEESGGYDGQFYAQIALDPLLRNAELERVIDAPAYRARRILAPAVAAIAGFGNPWLTLQAYALLNVLCWFVLGWLLHRQLAPADDLAFARWAGCMFSMGALESVRQSLVDLPALLLLALAITAWPKPPGKRPSLWLCLASLAKETSLLGALALHFEKSPRPFPWLRVGLSLLITILPIAAWAFYVGRRFADTPSPAGFGNFSWPLMGLFAQTKQSLRELFLGNFGGRFAFSLIAIIGFLIQAAFYWHRPRFESPWWRVGAAYSLLFVFLGSWVWSGYWAVCRAVLPMTVAFNLLLPATRAFWPLWTLGNLTMLHAIWRFL